MELTLKSIEILWVQSLVSLLFMNFMLQFPTLFLYSADHLGLILGPSFLAFCPDTHEPLSRRLSSLK